MADTKANIGSLKDRWRRTPRQARFDEVYEIVASRIDQGKPPYDEAWQSPYWKGDVFIFKEEEQFVLLRDIEWIRIDLEAGKRFFRMLTWDRWP